LFHGKGFDLLLLVPDEPEGTDAAAIRFQLPARLPVLDGAVVMLETGIAFLAGFVVLAIVIEPFDGEPGARGRGLPGLGVEPAGKWKFLRKLGTQALQITMARVLPFPFFARYTSVLFVRPTCGNIPLSLP
jgi:hypothetical protein